MDLEVQNFQENGKILFFSLFLFHFLTYLIGEDKIPHMSSYASPVALVISM